MKLLLIYWTIAAFLYFVASKLRNKADKFTFIDGALNVIIYLLVFVMGLRMGANREVTSNLATIGLQAVLITIFTVSGSMMAVTVVRKFLHLDRCGMPENSQGEAMSESVIHAEASVIEANEKNGAIEKISEKATDSSLKTTILILGFVVTGMLAGYFVIPQIFDDVNVFQDMSGDWLFFGICALLGTIGFNMGLSGEIINNLKNVGLNVIFFPFAAIAGSLLAGALYGVFSSLTVREGIAISAGFGWYTLAPSVIAEAGHVTAGAVAFMHNVIRETLGIIAIPIAAQKFGYIEATTIPGVAAMDMCIPIVERSCRTETVVYSFCIGIMMNIAVPLIVPIIIG